MKERENEIAPPGRSLLSSAPPQEKWRAKIGVWRAKVAMCGIIGILTRGDGHTKRLTSADLAKLRHRGPDGEGICNDAFVSFGHTRLAILDPSPAGAQPMWSRCNRYLITFNGEIYNYRELRSELQRRGHEFSTGTDTEVLLASFKEYGPGCVERLRGMFAFAIWDRRERELFAARDRCGERPFFYCFDGERFAFCSELKALIPHLSSSPQIDAAVVDMYLHFQYVPEPWTLLTEIKKLPAAHCLRLNVESWRIEQSRYWSLDVAPEVEGPVAARISAALEESVRLQLRSDVPVGIALSGGIDSGGIAAFARKHAGEGLHAFTVGYPGRPASDERLQARALGEHLGMIVHEVEIPVTEFVGSLPTMVHDLDEPIADPAAFAHRAVPAAAAAEGIKVLLGGIGGDEVFWGYEWTRRAMLINRIRSLIDRVRDPSRAVDGRLSSYVLAVLSGRWLPRSLRGWADAVAIGMRSRAPGDQPVFMDVSREFSDAAGVVAELGLPPSSNADGVLPRYWPTARTGLKTTDLRLRITEMLFETWLVSNCLTLGDRVAMARGVEMRQPFLDHGLIETVIGLQRKYPGWSSGHKPWLKAALRDTLPSDVLDRPKRGFTPPVHDWLRGAVMAYGTDVEDGVLTHASLVEPSATRRLIRSANEAAWPRLFAAYKLVVLEQWARQVAGLGKTGRVAA